jgi:hypothetical protein
MSHYDYPEKKRTDLGLIEDSFLGMVEQGHSYSWGWDVAEIDATQTEASENQTIGSGLCQARSMGQWHESRAWLQRFARIGMEGSECSINNRYGTINAAYAVLGGLEHGYGKAPTQPDDLVTGWKDYVRAMIGFRAAHCVPTEPDSHVLFSLNRRDSVESGLRPGLKEPDKVWPVGPGNRVMAKAQGWTSENGGAVWAYPNPAYLVRWALGQGLNQQFDIHKVWDRAKPRNPLSQGEQSDLMAFINWGGNTDIIQRLCQPWVDYCAAHGNKPWRTKWTLERWNDGRLWAWMRNSTNHNKPPTGLASYNGTVTYHYPARPTSTNSKRVEAERNQDGTVRVYTSEGSWDVDPPFSRAPDVLIEWGPFGIKVDGSQPSPGPDPDPQDGLTKEQRDHWWVEINKLGDQAHHLGETLANSTTRDMDLAVANELRHLGNRSFDRSAGIGRDLNYPLSQAGKRDAVNTQDPK